MKKIRFGVIGAGGIADRRTIPGILKSRHALVSALMNPREESVRQLCDKYGVPKGYTDAGALAQDEGWMPSTSRPRLTPTCPRRWRSAKRASLY